MRQLEATTLHGFCDMLVQGGSPVDGHVHQAYSCLVLKEHERALASCSDSGYPSSLVTVSPAIDIFPDQAGDCQPRLHRTGHCAGTFMCAILC